MRLTLSSKTSHAHMSFLLYAKAEFGKQLDDEILTAVNRRLHLGEFRDFEKVRGVQTVQRISPLAALRLFFHMN